MKLPVAIQFESVPPSPAIETAIHARLARIEPLCPDVTGWSVTVAQQAGQASQERSFWVRVDVTRPGHELVVTRLDDEDPQAALRKAFDAVEERLVGAKQVRRSRPAAVEAWQWRDGSMPGR